MPGTANTCRSCGRPVLWARLNTGRWAPLDPAPDERGQLVLLDGGRCHPVEPGARYGHDVQTRRHWDHLTTCGLGGRTRTATAAARDVTAAAARDVTAEATRDLHRARRLRLALSGGPAGRHGPDAESGPGR